MQELTEMAKAGVTTSDMAKKTKDKASRRIDEVTVAQGEAAHDAARTAAPIETQLEKIERQETSVRLCANSPKVLQAS